MVSLDEYSDWCPQSTTPQLISTGGRLLWSAYVTLSEDRWPCCCEETS